MGQLITTCLLAMLSASPALALELSAREWQERLAPHFAPRPQEEVKFDHYKMLNFKHGDDISRLSGEIEVTPPEKGCFVIQLRQDVPDQRICKKGVLKFTFRDLDQYGRLNAVVKSDTNLFGTNLMWTTPYRVAITVSEMKAVTSAPERWLIYDCHAMHDEKGRRIELSILGQKPWIIHFPAKDKLLPQPPPPPNLRIVEGDRVEGITEVAERRRLKKDAEKRLSEGGPADVMLSKQSSAPEERMVWSLPIRGSYEMSADNFQPASHLPKGGAGTCWYRYEGSVNDPGVGRIECRGGHKFRSAYMPLKCLAEIKIDR